jgi:hypothetical protein
MREAQGHTIAVDERVFREVYDSPASLPGQYCWVTSDQDVREMEKLLRMPPGTVGAPLWVSGDRKTCESCDRVITWLDIVSSGLARAHEPEMIARVILGNQKYINTEAPRAIADVRCFGCGTPFTGLRSFKCHNWAYAATEMLEVIQRMKHS